MMLKPVEVTVFRHIFVQTEVDSYQIIRPLVSELSYARGYYHLVTHGMSGRKRKQHLDT